MLQAVVQKKLLQEVELAASTGLAAEEATTAFWQERMAEAAPLCLLLCLLSSRCPLAPHANTLQDLPVLELLTDYPRPRTFASDGSMHASVPVSVDASTVSALLSQQGGLQGGTSVDTRTLPPALLAAWAATLGRHAAQDEVMVGLLAGTSQQPAVGGSNTLCIAVRGLEVPTSLRDPRPHSSLLCPKERTFAQLASSVRVSCEAALQHATLRFWEAAAAPMPVHAPHATAQAAQCSPPLAGGAPRPTSCLSGPRRVAPHTLPEHAGVARSHPSSCSRVQQRPTRGSAGPGEQHAAAAAPGLGGLPLRCAREWCGSTRREARGGISARL